jgi:YD repeat-containing protein
MQAIDQTKATRRAGRQSQRTLFALCPILIILAALLVGAALTSADTTTVVGGALPSATSTPAGLDNPMVTQNPETVPLVDLDLDSDHTHDYDGWPVTPEPTDIEDGIEDGSGTKTEYSGLKFVVVNDFYEADNLAAIEGFADGYDLNNSSTCDDDDVMEPPYGPTNKEVFVEMHLALDGCTNYSRTHVTFNYPESDPWAVCTNSGVDGIDYHDVPTNGYLRIWTADQSTNRSDHFIHSGSNYIASALGFSLISKVKTFYVEAVAHSAALEDLRIEAEAYEVTDDGPTPTSVDAVRVTAIRCDVDVDSNNDDGASLTRSGGEDRYEDIGTKDYPGKILVINNNDDDGDGIIDYFDGFDRTSNAADNETANEVFIPIIFEILEPINLDYAKVRIDYPGSNPADISDGSGVPVLPADGSIRIWNVSGATPRSGEPIQSGGNYLEPGYEYDAADLGFSSTQRIVTNYIEAVKVSAAPADIRIVMNVDPDGDSASSSTPGYIAVDAVRCTVLCAPELIAVTDYFTPRQSESPPYHVCKADYRWCAETPDGLPVSLWVEVKAHSASWGSLFYTRAFPSGTAPDTPFYELGARYNVSGLYGGTATQRVGWDGRKDSAGDGITDKLVFTNAAGRVVTNEIWANRPINIDAADEEYDIRMVVKYDIGFNLASGVLTTKTCPMQHLKLAGENVPFMGRAPYFGFFRDTVNSLVDSLSILGPSLIPASDGRPVPFLRTYHNGNHWRHTPMGFGWTHNFEIRMLPVFIGGDPKLYVLWESDHLCEVTNDFTWIYGEKFDVGTQTNGWTMTNRLQTVYTFDDLGQLTNVMDSSGNAIDLELEEFSSSHSDVWVQRYKRIKFAPNEHTPAATDAPSLEMTLQYEHASGTHLTQVNLEGRSVTYEYAEAADVYGIPYGPDETIKSMTGPQYKWTFGQDQCRRRDRPSRIIAGSIANFTVDGVPHTYAYGTAEDLTTVKSEAKVNHYITGTGGSIDDWRVTEITGQTATWTVNSGDSVSETHTYTTNKLQAICRSGPDSASFAYGFDAKGRQLQTTGAQGQIITRVYDEPAFAPVEAGNLTSVIYPDAAYGTVNYSYTPSNRVKQIEIPAMAPDVRCTEFFHDGHGNVTNMTQRGAGALPDRTWLYVRNPDGSIQSIRDPSNIVTDVSYMDNNQGLPTLQNRSSVPPVTLMSVMHDPFGNVVVKHDERGYPTLLSYDGWDRMTNAVYPGGKGTASWTWNALNLPLTTVTPGGNGSGAGAVTTNNRAATGKPRGMTITGTDVVTLSVTNSAVDNEGNVLTTTVSQVLRAEL